MSRLVDLSHPLEDGMPAYPGLPPMRIQTLLEREASRPRYGGLAEFLITGFEIAGNTGTYLDAPFHRFADGVDLASVPLASCVGLDGVCVDRRDERAFALDGVPDEALGGRAVLFRSGRDASWGSEAYWREAPYLSRATVERLVAVGAALVGIDTGNVDDTADLERPAHTRLLGAAIPIVENLTNLGALSHHGFRFSAAPLPIPAGTAVPVRAYAEVP